MPQSNKITARKLLKIAAISAAVPAAAFAGFTVVSHVVFHRSNMATASEQYHWLKGTRKRMQEPLTWDNYILSSADSNEQRYSVPKALDFHYKMLGFRVPIEETDVAGSQVFVLNRHDINDRAVIYLHGGTFLSQPSSSHWHFIDTVARKTRAEFIVPLYPLAPAHHWDEAFALLEQVWKKAVNKYGADNVSLMGDEAGAGLAAAFAEYLAAQGKAQPANLILISPWVDLSLGNPLVNDLQSRDPLLSAYGMRKVGKLWANGLDLHDYRLSPINGEVRGLRNVLVLAGTREILYPDARLFFERARAAGVHAEFVRGRGLNNNFPLDPLPEASRAIEKICSVISHD